jgi:FkbH-like protein
MKTLERLLEEEDYEGAWWELYASVRQQDDYTAFQSLWRWRQRLAQRSEPPRSKRTLRVALLGGTTEFLENPLRLLLESIGLGSDIHRSEFNTFAQEMLEAESATIAFNPDVAVLVITAAHVPTWPAPGDELHRVNELVSEVCDHFLDLCSVLHGHAHCEIVVNNFHSFSTRPLGNLAAKTAWDRNNFLRRVNLVLGERAPSYLHINDVDALSAEYGLSRWFDSRYWFHAKQPVSFECLVPYARNTARIIGALYGITAKCIVLDLDNTLWGGVVGDDGLDGIAIGEGDAISEAYKAFQEYLLKLKQRGVLLAVCSKNEEAIAKAAFDLPEMVLGMEDFVAFVANWEAKPNNILQIAEALNIGIDSVVFVDDNPAEREHVRQVLPEVEVVELTDDPADYPRLLDRSGLFETTRLSKEDQQRTRQYQDNLARKRLAAKSGDYAGFLVSLEQRAVIRPFEERHLDRITQLINKTNQFNLTTLRLNRSQVEDMMIGERIFTAYVRLRDRFGDNGLISALAAHREEEELSIELWLMSCRVLKRGVEQALCNFLVEQAREVGLRRIRGVYKPTAKNGLVREHFRSLGFAQEGTDEDGITRWSLEVDSYQPSQPAIEMVEDY